MKNQGISLISLIITIIVIIILAAIVIFSGMDTPERAQLSNFAQEVSNVHSAVLDKLTDVTINHTSSGETRNAEQLYFELATGVDCGQFGYMSGDGTTQGTATMNDAACQNILPTQAKGYLGITLPNVRESNTAWYVTKNGQVFNATGFVSGGKTYFTADLYYNDDDIVMTANDRTKTAVARAKEIATAISNGQTGAIEITNKGF